MVAITYVQPNGKQKAVQAKPGTTVMLAAIGNGVDGIVAECGGNAMCATCHVSIDPEHFAALPAIGDDEDALLDATAVPRGPTSRLGCQVELTAAQDGMVVTVPDRQV